MKEGVDLVNRAGTSLKEIVVADIVTDIATASTEQATRRYAGCFASQSSITTGVFRRGGRCAADSQATLGGVLRFLIIWSDASRRCGQTAA